MVAVPLRLSLLSPPQHLIRSLGCVDGGNQRSNTSDANHSRHSSLVKFGTLCSGARGWGLMVSRLTRQLRHVAPCREYAHATKACLSDGSVTQRLGDVADSHHIVLLKVGDGSRDLDHAMICASRKRERL